MLQSPDALNCDISRRSKYNILYVFKNIKYSFKNFLIKKLLMLFFKRVCTIFQVLSKISPIISFTIKIFTLYLSKVILVA